MPINIKKEDCSPLVVDYGIEITDSNLLSEFIGKIIMGHYYHVKEIIKDLEPNEIDLNNLDIDLAIAQLDSSFMDAKKIEKRDGWIFQIISWIAMLIQNQDLNYYCQQPHDAPAQHGLDGISTVISDDDLMSQITIQEDKCTTSPRGLIPTVWKEFENFEKGLYNNKIVSRISSMIEHLKNGEILNVNRNSIYDQSIWTYRIGINRKSYHRSNSRRIKLFKGFDEYVEGSSSDRRNASTFEQEDIRKFMEELSLQIIIFLKTKKEEVV